MRGPTPRPFVGRLADALKLPGGGVQSAHLQPRRAPRGPVSSSSSAVSLRHKGRDIGGSGDEIRRYRIVEHIEVNITGRNRPGRRSTLTAANDTLASEDLRRIADR